MEAEVDQLLTTCQNSGPLKLTQLEDLALAARQRLGQKLIERLLALQGETHPVAAPVNAETGKPLHSKGKKNSL